MAISQSCHEHKEILLKLIKDKVVAYHYRNYTAVKDTKCSDIWSKARSEHICSSQESDQEWKKIHTILTSK